LPRRGGRPWNSSTIGRRGAARESPALSRYWATEHDWRTCEAKLNVLPQFTTEIEGVS
jgi:hypothetical protein